MSSFSKICVVGLGYIGLPTAAVFASRKVQVVGVDVNPEAVETINRGKIHIVEPELDILVHSTVMGGFLRASGVPEPADAFLIAVPTPFKGNNHEPDLSYIEKACASIAPVLKSGDLVVLESTSPVGATEQMADWLSTARPDLSFPKTGAAAADVSIAHCPERVLPGKVLHELVENDRLIGGMTTRCAERAAELYRMFVKGECIITSARTAEMAKLTENSFRDVNIAFANELSMICDKLDINVWELIALANRHPRVNILQPGPGVGGHCIAVDPWFIVAGTPAEARIIRTAREVNDSKPDWVLAKVREAVASITSARPGTTGSDVKIICYGLAFKPDIDDLRESPASAIVKSVVEMHSGTVVAVEPNIKALPPGLDGITLVGSEALPMDGDLHLMLVDHRQFKSLPKPSGIVIDTRGVWE
jgi:UDP-N-acetyl-D-mannosaminuronic acid dehydrogenase